MTEPKDPMVYEHLITDISYAALRIVSRAVRAAVGGTLDLTVQVELENFANECDNRIQHHEREVRKAKIAELNAEHKGNPPAVIHIVVADPTAETEEFDDLI